MSIVLALLTALLSFGLVFFYLKWREIRRQLSVVEMVHKQDKEFAKAAAKQAQEPSSVSSELEKVKIPKPSDMLAPMIILWLAKQEANDKFCKSEGALYFDIPISNRTLKLTVLRACRDFVGRIVYDYNDFYGAEASLTGEPHARKIYLSLESQRAIAAETGKLAERSMEARRLRLEGESEQAALDALEGLLVPELVEVKAPA